MQPQILLECPSDFKAKFEASGVFCEHQERILFLRRHPHKVEGLTWSIPGGKKEAAETPIETAIRELAEETGLQAAREQLKPLCSFHIRKSTGDFIFHTFFLFLAQIPLLHINYEENIESMWVTPEHALQLPLISGGKEIIEHFSALRP